MSLAVYIPVGPEYVEVYRLWDLLDSLSMCERGVSWLILVDDGCGKRCLDDVASFYKFPKVLTVPNPRGHEGEPHTGGLCTATLTALRIVYCQTDADVAIKLDTDSLVIAPFYRSIKDILASTTNLGLLGVVGLSSNPALRSGYDIQYNRKMFEAALKIPPSFRSLTATDFRQLNEWGITDNETFEHFICMRALLRHIHSAGFTLGEYCQGGGYAVSRKLIATMHERGHLATPEKWRNIKCGEDVMMGIYCKALGFDMGDLSQPGCPFAIQPKGLPYAPRELYSLGYSIVHSVKSDERYSEAGIRQFFRTMRKAQRRHL